MRILLKLLLMLIVLVPVALAAAAYLAVERTPLVRTEVRLTPAQVNRAKAILDQHDPRELRDGEVRTIGIRKRDLDLALNYLVHLFGRGGSLVDLDDGAMRVRATARLPRNPVGEYVNLDVVLRETPGIPELHRLEIGRLPVPQWMAGGLLHVGLRAFHERTGRRLESDLVRGVAMTPASLRITYEWDSELADTVKGAVVSQEDRARLKIYHQRLVEVVSAGSAPIALVDIMQPLFRLAEERSSSGIGAADENRAAIIALAAYVGGRGLAHVAPESETWPSANKRKVLLGGRTDFAQHFTVSASLSMVGGDVLSNAIGLLKEIDDSRGGTGFSFSDLGADKAGTRFGERATSFARAAEIQSRISRSLSDADILPRVDDLPEHMSESEFTRRFGDVNDPRYQQMVARIDQRVDRLALYR